PRPAAPSAPVRRGPYGRPVPREMLEKMHSEGRADKRPDERGNYRRDERRGSERRYDRSDRHASEAGHERRHAGAPRSSGYAPRAEKRDYGAHRFEKGAVRHRTGDQ
ncbi:MAG: hypothetical protein SOT57_01115, partial [Eubacteriales bacterium]|nr:hypothetical protein [Eubacteriales bacterium]